MSQLKSQAIAHAKSKEVAAVPTAQIRPYGMIKAHAIEEDFTVYQPATFEQRWYAFAIDMAFYAPLSLLIRLPFERYLDRLDAFGYSGRYVTLMFFLWLLPLLLYFVGPTALWGQTLGKRIVGVRVIGASFQPIQPFEAILLRETLGKWVSLVTLGIGFFMAKFTKRHRALHDYMAKTVVISYRVR